MEDYTNKSKGEQVEVALFGGDYQDGVLTAYCLLDDVAHLELNGHILIPLQNIASLHCSSRCDAPEPDWPPRGLDEDEQPEDADHARRLVAAGTPQAWLLVIGGCAAVAAIALPMTSYRLVSLLVSSACSCRRRYWYGDRVRSGWSARASFPWARTPAAPRACSSLLGCRTRRTPPFSAPMDFHERSPPGAGRGAE